MKESLPLCYFNIFCFNNSSKCSIATHRGLRLANTNQGFVGCIRYVEINGEELDISSSGSSVEYGANVGECGNDPCQSKEVPCFNNGICEALNAESYRCICQGDFFGESILDIGVVYSRSEGSLMIYIHFH